MRGMKSVHSIDLPPGLSAEDWPVVIYTAPQTIEDEGFQRVLDAMAAIRALEQPYAMILDLRFNKGITPVQRRMITSSMQEREQQSVRLLRGLALIFKSRLMTSLLTAIFWVRKPPYEVRVFSELAPALAWARERVDGRRIAASA